MEDLLAQVSLADEGGFCALCSHVLISGCSLALGIVVIMKLP